MRWGLDDAFWNGLDLFAKIDFDVPVLDAHSAVLGHVLLHLEGTVEELRLVTNTACDTILGRHLQVVCEDRLVLRMSTLLDDQLGALFRCNTAEVGQTLLSDQNVEVMLSVVDMRGLRYNTGDTEWIGFARAC